MKTRNIFIAVLLSTAAIFTGFNFLQAQTVACTDLHNEFTVGATDATTGGEVSKLHTYLISLHINWGASSNTFNTNILSGLKRFQSRSNLPITGYTDTATRALIKSQTGCPATSSGDNSGNSGNAGGSNQNPKPSWTVSGGVLNGTQGQAVSQGVRVQGSALSDGIVDIEIYNASNQKVYQTVIDHQNISQGDNKSYVIAWTPTQPGIYYMSAGVFQALGLRSISGVAISHRSRFKLQL
jgi:hypothetical protein